MNNNSLRATSNLAMLEFVARKLGPLNNEVVYVGGCTTALFINDLLSLDVRPTDGVDCIVDVVSRPAYYKFADALTKLGFKQSMEDSIICRWRYDGIMLDVMPTDQKILGFGNTWYKKALNQAISHQIAEDHFVQSITAPYFLATKIEAALPGHLSDGPMTITIQRIKIVNDRIKKIISL